jgi:GTP1/Obg family GTP-binding protein
VRVVSADPFADALPGRVLVVVRAIAEPLEFVSHVLDRPSEVGQLASDQRSLLVGGHPVCRVLRMYLGLGGDRLGCSR